MKILHQNIAFIVVNVRSGIIDLSTGAGNTIDLVAGIFSYELNLSRKWCHTLREDNIEKETD